MAQLTLQTGYDDDYDLCVKVGGKSFKTPQSLRDAFPQLLSEAQGSPPLTLQLAAALAHLRGQGELVSDVEATFAEIEAFAEPPLVKVPRWTSAWVQAGPEPRELHAPAWEGGRLVFYVWRSDWGLHTKHVFAQRLELDPESWELAWTNLEGRARPLSKVAAAAEAAFGGPVEGFFTVQLPSYSHVLIGVGAGLTSRCVWFERAASEPERFGDYSSFAAAHPEALEPKALTQVARDLVHFYSDEAEGFNNLQVIPDGAAYQEEYRQNNYGTFKLRYWVDQIRETSCHVPDLETVATPALEGEVLKAYFKGEKYQPYRLVADLSSLSLAAPPTPAPMASETFVYDTREGGHPELRPKPTPASLELSPPSPELGGSTSPLTSTEDEFTTEGGHPLKGG